MAKVATQGLVSSNAVQYVAGPLKSLDSLYMIGFLSVWNEGVGVAALGSPVSVLAVTNGAVERIPTVVDIMKKNVDEKVQSKC
ncbi:hypothetical protein RHGRI_023781 [Rhododendron griersonianum]|uniref:Uncharacterized protein n=1 Tax=Rhododendron griersonianum TaxID=479676 RepID=A0AAV6J6U4_9ERIC|nr:hypothetical protein RHGRI_023781 [Rhododendron griersonianum]